MPRLPGATVEVVSTPAQGTTSGVGTVLVPAATVLSMSADPNGSGNLVSVVVPAADASAVASAAAGDDVSLVMLAGTGG
jgi:hypothetical protein